MLSAITTPLSALLNEKSLSATTLLFVSIAKDYKVIISKMQNPGKDWTSITYDLGYSD